MNLQLSVEVPGTPRSPLLPSKKPEDASSRGMITRLNLHRLSNTFDPSHHFWSLGLMITGERPLRDSLVVLHGFCTLRHENRLCARAWGLARETPNASLNKFSKYLENPRLTVPPKPLWPVGSYTAYGSRRVVFNGRVGQVRVAVLGLDACGSGKQYNSICYLATGMAPLTYFEAAGLCYNICAFEVDTFAYMRALMFPPNLKFNSNLVVFPNSPQEDLCSSFSRLRRNPQGWEATRRGSRVPVAVMLATNGTEAAKEDPIKTKLRFIV